YGQLEQIVKTQPVDFLQVNYSAAEPQAERSLLPLAQEHGVAVIANRPFAGGGLLSRLGQRPLPPFAADFGATSWAQVLLKYIVAHPAVTCAIPGTNNPRHVLENLGAAVGPLPDASLRQRIR